MKRFSLSNLTWRFREMNEIVHIFVDTPNILVIEDQEDLGIRTRDKSQRFHFLPIDAIDWTRLYNIARRESPAAMNMFVRGMRYDEAKDAVASGSIPEFAKIMFPRQGKDVDVMLIASMFEAATNALMQAPPGARVRIVIFSGDTDYTYALGTLRRLAAEFGRELDIDMYSWKFSSPKWERETQLLDSLKGGFCYLDSLKDEILIRERIPPANSASPRTH